MLKAENIHKSYSEIEVLKGISLEIQKGELVSIVGKSGSGKSTLLHILGTLDLPNTGSVSIANTNINSLNAKELAEFRNKNIGFLSDRMDHKPAQMSGGEQQRVAIARALVNKPIIVFADEPTGNLDTQTSEELHSLFKQVNKDLETTFVIVTHNEHFANICDHKFTIEDGLII